MLADIYILLRVGSGTERIYMATLLAWMVGGILFIPAPCLPYAMHALYYPFLAYSTLYMGIAMLYRYHNPLLAGIVTIMNIMVCVTLSWMDWTSIDGIQSGDAHVSTTWMHLFYGWGICCTISTFMTGKKITRESIALSMQRLGNRYNTSHARMALTRRIPARLHAQLHRHLYRSA